jgi:exopolyphosphatase/pppGpp-phosphohydrolase
VSNTALIVIAVAALIVAALAFYAGRLLWQLQQQIKEKQQQLAKKQQYLRDSITLICKAMRQEQCELSEGALRLWVLLDHLAPERQPDPVSSYPGLYQMYQVVKDMPTHKARKAQAAELTQQQDTLRIKAEQQLKDVILADADALLKRFQPD